MNKRVSLQFSSWTLVFPVSPRIALKISPARGEKETSKHFFPILFFFAVLIALLSRRHDCTLTIGSGSENIPPEKWPIAKNVHGHYMPLTNSQLRKIKSWVLHFSCVAKYDNRAQENATDFPDRSVSPEIRRHQRTEIKLSISHFNRDMINE